MSETGPFKRNRNNMIIAAVCVDDLLVLANNKDDKLELKRKWPGTSGMNDLGAVKYK